MSTTNWHLPRASPRTEQQRHLPSASTEIETHAASAIDLQQSLRELRVERDTLCSRESGGTGLETDFMISILASPHREALNPFMVTSDPHEEQKNLL